MGRFLRPRPLDEVRTSAVSQGAVVVDGPLRKRATIAHPNPLRPNADAVDGEPSIQNDAATDTVFDERRSHLYAGAAPGVLLLCLDIKIKVRLYLHFRPGYISSIRGLVLDKFFL